MGSVSPGRVGIFLGQHGNLDARDLRSTAALIEELGYGTIWVGEGFAREVFTASAMLLASTSRIVVATGIANIYARDAVAMANGARALSEAWPDRFILGLGVSHAHLVSRRGHDYSGPVAAMRAYIDALAEAPYVSQLPKHPAPVVIGALGPRMIALAAERTAGAYTYFVDEPHTRQARVAIGPGRFLAVNLPVVVARDRHEARTTADPQMRVYLGMPNYRDNLARGGWSAQDLQDAGSDELFDAIVGWGDADRVAAKIAEHFAAGADHVVMNVVTATPSRPAGSELQLLAERLLH